MAFESASKALGPHSCCCQHSPLPEQAGRIMPGGGAHPGPATAPGNALLPLPLPPLPLACLGLQSPWNGSIRTKVSPVPTNSSKGHFWASPNGSKGQAKESTNQSKGHSFLRKSPRVRAAWSQTGAMPWLAGWPQFRWGFSLSLSILICQMGRGRCWEAVVLCHVPPSVSSLSLLRMMTWAFGSPSLL